MTGWVAPRKSAARANHRAAASRLPTGSKRHHIRGQRLVCFLLIHGAVQLEAGDSNPLRLRRILGGVNTRSNSLEVASWRRSLKLKSSIPARSRIRRHADVTADRVTGNTCSSSCCFSSQSTISKASFESAIVRLSPFLVSLTRLRLKAVHPHASTPSPCRTFT